VAEEVVAVGLIMVHSVCLSLGAQWCPGAEGAHYG
jgi:hypothetical protein